MAFLLATRVEAPRAVGPAMFLSALLVVAPLAAQGRVALIGGGTESSTPSSWSEEPYGWIAEHSGTSPVVVLSTRTESQWIPEYFEQLGAVDAFNLQVGDRATAEAEATAATIRSAGGVFIKGGDQWDYKRLWEGTQTADAIHDVWLEGGVVAGTSAGAMILGEVVFDAAHGSIYPEEAIRDPFEVYMSLSEGFVGLLPGVLIDTHFTGRGRLVRQLAMLGRWEHERPGSDVLGIGVDAYTALLISPDLKARVAGEGTVTFAKPTERSRWGIVPGRPPVATDIACDRLTEGFVYDLAERRVSHVPQTADVDLPVPPFVEPSELMLNGANAMASKSGPWWIDNVTSDPDALELGMLHEAEGCGCLAGLLVMSQAFVEPSFIENRVGGLQWMLANHPRYGGVLIDAGATVDVAPTGWLEPLAGVDEPSVLFIDARDLWAVDYSRWVISDEAEGPRQSTALAGLRLHLLASGWRWDPFTGTIVSSPRSLDGWARVGASQRSRK